MFRMLNKEGRVASRNMLLVEKTYFLSVLQIWLKLDWTHYTYGGALAGAGSNEV